MKGYSVAEYLFECGSDGKAALQKVIDNLRHGGKGYRVVIEVEGDHLAERNAFDVYDQERLRREFKEAMNPAAAPAVVPVSPATLASVPAPTPVAPQPPQPCITITEQNGNFDTMTVDQLAWCGNGRAIIDAISASLDRDRGAVRKQMLLTDEPFDGTTVYNITNAAAFKEQAAALIAKQDRLADTGA